MKNIRDFAKELSLDVKTIEKLTRDNFNYYHFTIPKGNGRKRLITAPKGKLKVIQKWILVNYLEKFAVAKCATAFIKGRRGIEVNAKAHQHNKYILEFDLKDFFPNIRFWDVQNLFLRMNLNRNISLLFAKLCTYNGYLPQGAITSPYISNLMCYDLDLKLLELSNEYNITYTRYADDLRLLNLSAFCFVMKNRDNYMFFYSIPKNSLSINSKFSSERNSFCFSFLSIFIEFVY